MAIRISAFGMSFDISMVAKSNVHKTTLIGAHGLKAHRTMLTDGALSSTLGHLNKLVVATAPITLNIDDDGKTESKLTANQEREDRLERLKSATMATDKHREIRSGYVKNDLTVITLIFIDGRIGGIKVAQDIPQDGDGDVNHAVKFIV